MKPSKRTFFIILACIMTSILVAVTGIGKDIKGVTKMRFGIDIRGGVEAIFEPKDILRKATSTELESARNIIETRLDAQNITDREVTIDKDSGYIIVRFPWKSDESNFNPEDAIAELGEMAQLTFKDPQGNILLEGKNVVSSEPIQDSSGVIKEYCVSLNFDAAGAKLFEEATRKLLNQTISIYMDDILIQSAEVQSVISGGKAVITNMKSYEEAVKLSEKINAGALPFSLETTNFNTISPTLGSNALNIMMIAGLISFFLVCLFMIIYYKLPGFVACMVLVLQTVLQLLAISIPQYTLTLPGIAGIILSLGMAVDANIIISERIIEETGKGFTIRSAIKNGYKNAFSSVLDGNITTAIVAVILMIFGSGAMLSFGYTLLIGMIVNVFVGVFVSKILLQSMVEWNRWNQDKYFREYRKQKVKKFYEHKWLYTAISGSIIAAGILACVIGGVRLDTQFTGGAVLCYHSEADLDLAKVDAIVEKITNRPVTVQSAQDYVKQTMSITITLAGNQGMSVEQQKQITKAMQEQAGGQSIELAQTYAVEPYIGAKALKNAVIAIVLAVLFIIVYIWIRFSGLSAGITATIALIHDVMVVFFAFVIFKIPLNDAFVAVVLTIIGYSINDTIVLYDRMRENKNVKDKLPAVGLFNKSITQTMRRSIHTSLTTGFCILTILIAAVIFRIDSICEFAIPMFCGLISGCYSSICIAGTIWAAWENHKESKKLKTDSKILDSAEE